MSALLSIALLSLLLLSNLSSASYQPQLATIPPSGHDNVHMACKASRDPPTCQASILHSNHVHPNATVLQVIQSALWVSSRNLNKGRRLVREILEASAGNQNRSNVAKVCIEVLYYSKYRTNMTAQALSRRKIKDAHAWMSAALGYQYACWGGLKHVNDSSQNGEGWVLGIRVVFLSFQSTGRRAVGLKADLTVCKGGDGCDYESVQQAVNAAPEKSDKPFVIFIKSGVYEEKVRVPLGKRNVVFLGDGIGRTVITGSMNVMQPGINTYNSATVGVIGDRFMASGITFQNTAGPNANQAVAFRSDSDLSVIENCEFIGNQDTLYANSLRQKEYSEQGCHRNGRTDPAQSTGFVFQNCVINGTDAYMDLHHGKPDRHKNYLGRPWKEYSRTVFMHCTIGDLIAAEGWMPWSGDFALKTLYFGELENTGPGSDTSRRVSWSSQIPPQYASSYSVQNFIQGDQWIPRSS
ncbi:putative pectinesterase/pectinesterase inhibitor 51 [Sesamum angolense]|uniref:Pectinesterase/pectinesterase inhibitor 51 n=1 Tax=Sesamum angolense TaxID=2727404 RepID=A0AAE1XDS2_9LAMI|nr:putative pectinesterase/pectinesterase inhibitor 51 [Sesamum angolense]